MWVGGLIKEFNRLGFHACGIETSSFAVQKCRQQGLEVFEGRLTEAALGARKFDVITMIEVIEHLSDPVTVMRQIALLLKPYGIVHVQTGNVELAFSYLRRVDRGLKYLAGGGRRGANLSRAFDPILWGYFSLEGHVSYFSPRTLAFLYAKCGLEPVPVGRLRTRDASHVRSFTRNRCPSGESRLGSQSDIKR